MNPESSLSSHQESIWEYPRRPILRPSRAEIEVIHGDKIIAHTIRALLICENGHPPSYYLPPEDVRMELMEPSEQKTFCEWKGVASYFHLITEGKPIPNVAWTYEEPSRGYEGIANYLALYPQLLDYCLVDGEVARPEPRDFYGGWITDRIGGPFR